MNLKKSLLVFRARTGPLWLGLTIVKSSVSQPPGRDPVPGPGIIYTWPREVLLEVVILVF
jgi:hypothetical protein